MKYSTLLRILSFMLLFGVVQINGYSQEDEDTTSNKYITSTVEDSSLIEVKKSEFQLDFYHFEKTYLYNKGKNDKSGKTGTYNRYWNPEQDALIQKLERKGEHEELLKVLEEYVLNFSIGNFSEDVYKLWKLAQLYEYFDQEEKAKHTYKLALKHFNPDLTSADEIEQFFQFKEHYDEISINDEKQYVPLKDYYELVEYRKAVDTLRPPKSVLLNMGDIINKPKVPEYAPALNLNNDIILITKRELDIHHLGTTPVYKENLYYSEKFNGEWGSVKKMPAPINSSCNEGSATLSKDGKLLIFSRCEVKGRNNLDCRECLGRSCELYFTILKEDSTWTLPKNLGKKVNSVGWESQPTLSHNDDTLFFASNRPGGFGLSDIYYSIRINDTTWGEARNLGPIINTAGQDQSPFYHPEHHVLYFSSNGHLLNFSDLGIERRKTRSFDLYKTNIIENKWQEPKNIGPLVNGKGNETYFTIDSESKVLYYARTEEGVTNQNITDLFSFPLPMEAQPTATTTLYGTVIDPYTGKPHKGIVSIIDLDNGIEVSPQNIRQDGSYEFDLINQNNYVLVIQGDDFFRIEKLFYLNGDTTITTESEHIKNKKLQFTTIVFDNGKWDIKPGMEDDLKNVVNFLIDNPKFNLVISGHTDKAGNPQANISLSQKRAEAIKEYLEDEGFIDNKRIEAIGMGSQKPIKEPEITEEDKRINRRVEFEIFFNENYDQEQREREEAERIMEEAEEDDEGWD